MDIGDRVEAGQVLARLSIPEMAKELDHQRASVKSAQAMVQQTQAGIRQAEARIVGAEAALAEAQTQRGEKEAQLKLRQAEFERTKELVDRGSFLKKKLDEAQFSLEAAEAAIKSVDARIRSAEAELVAVKADVEKARFDSASAEDLVTVANAELEKTSAMMDYATIRAPFAGLVTKRMVDQGAFIQPAQGNSSAKPLLTVSATAVVRLRLDLPMGEVQWLDRGDRAILDRINALPGETFEGTVTRYSSTLDPTSRTMRVEIDLPNADHRLSPGYYGYVTLILNEFKDVPTVPSSAVMSDDEGLFVNLSLADVLFDPLAARQVADAAESDEVAVFNDTLLQVAVSYLQLVRATSRAAIFELAVQNSERLAKITEDFARAGEGYEADAQRAAAALANQRRELLRSREDEQVASAQLARLLRLDPAITLLPTDQQAIPIDMVSTSDSLDDLIMQAIAARPEVSRQESMVAESSTRIDQEHWRPLLPNVYAGFNGGGFGGSRGSDIANFSDKTDFDIAAIWQLENFGCGNAARRRLQDSRHRQAHLASEQARDNVAAQVTEAYSRVQSRQRQIAAVATEIEAADRALALNFDGIRGAVLRPIEAQQAIDAFVDARLEQLDTVVSYNAAQLELLRAIGLPPHATVQP